LQLFSFGGYGLALAALALVGFGAIECPPENKTGVVRIFQDRPKFSYINKKLSPITFE